MYVYASAMIPVTIVQSAPSSGQGLAWGAIGAATLTALVTLGVWWFSRRHEREFKARTTRHEAGVEALKVASRLLEADVAYLEIQRAVRIDYYRDRIFDSELEMQRRSAEAEWRSAQRDMKRQRYLAEALAIAGVSAAVKEIYTLSNETVGPRVSNVLARVGTAKEHRDVMNHEILKIAELVRDDGDTDFGARTSEEKELLAGARGKARACVTRALLWSRRVIDGVLKRQAARAAERAESAAVPEAEPSSKRVEAQDGEASSPFGPGSAEEQLAIADPGDADTTSKE